MQAEHSQSLSLFFLGHLPLHSQCLHSQPFPQLYSFSNRLLLLAPPPGPPSALACMSSFSLGSQWEQPA